MDPRYYQQNQYYPYGSAPPQPQQYQQPRPYGVPSQAGPPPPQYHSQQPQFAPQSQRPLVHPAVVIPQRSQPQYPQHYQQYPQYASPQMQYSQIPQPAPPPRPMQRPSSAQQPQVRSHHSPHVQSKPQHSSPYPQDRPMRTQTYPQTPTPRTTAPPEPVKATPQSRPTPAPTPTASSARAPSPQQKPVDIQLVLLSIAEEYVSAAHGMGPVTALQPREEDVEQYHRLIATALGCMETVLKNFRLHPKQEAKLILRYATLMYEETDNDLEGETLLSRGIELCTKNHYFDLKYSMQHLLFRLMYKGNPRVALKAIDKLIPDVEAYQHVVWIYAFRFLRVSLSLQSRSHPETMAALQHLKQIISLAERCSDISVFVTSSVFEALLQVRNAAADSVEQAQRAIAAARSYQLQVSMVELGPVIALLDFLDLVCNLQHYVKDQAKKSMDNMQKVLEGTSAKKDDGAFSVPIDRSTDKQLTESTGGVFQRQSSGKIAISFTWLPPRDLYALGFYLSGVASHRHNPLGEKGQAFLEEGIKVLDAFRQDTKDKPCYTTSSSSDATRRLSFHNELEWHLRLQLTFVQCHRLDWKHARRSLYNLRQVAQSQEGGTSESDLRLLTYLEGVIKQGSGDRDAALSYYQLPVLALPQTPPKASSVDTDLRVLASLNTFLIIRNPQHPQHFLSDAIISALEPYCLSHPNQNIVSAYSLLKTDSISIVEKKKSLQTSLVAARTVSNTQLLAICMNMLVARFFIGIVGDQAKQSTQAARKLALQSKDNLWLSVADGMLAQTMDLHGLQAEAENARQEGEKAWMALPEDVKAGLMRGQQHQTLA